MKYILSLVILSSFCLGGCVGVWEYKKVSDVTSYVGSQQTKQSILELYGDPDNVEKSGNKEIWHSSKKRGWTGFMPILVAVPLPFIFPSDYWESTFEFEGDKVLSYKSTHIVDIINGCGLFLILPFPIPIPMCYSGKY